MLVKNYQLENNLLHTCFVIFIFWLWEKKEKPPPYVLLTKYDFLNQISDLGDITLRQSTAFVCLGGLGVTCRLEIEGSRVQIWLRLMDFSGRKNPEHKSSGRDFKLGVPSLRFQAH